jgi:DNA-binding HxlR family transcriptional regulator
MAEPENGSSPLAEALARVGDRWTLLVVEALLGGPQRFNDLLGQIPGIAAPSMDRTSWPHGMRPCWPCVETTCPATGY